MIVVAILGLVLPGYAVARALGIPFAWAAAFPLSALLLTESAIAFDRAGIPLRFGTMLVPLLVISVTGLVIGRRPPHGQVDPPPETRTPAARVVRTLSLLVLGLVLLGTLVRTSLFPLSGFDTVFRWEALARLMLEQQGFAHYPPMTAEDFGVYFFPDGMPPLTATIYWWLYAAWGRPLPALTTIAVCLQLASCAALVFHAARLLFGSTGGHLAMTALLTSSIFLEGVAMGQETGYTALAVAGQLAFGLAAVRGPRLACVVTAALFAGLGTLAREYGPLLAVSGLAIFAWSRATRPSLPVFCLIAAACAAPWYLRNWLLTGNPVYPLGGVLGFPGNAAYALIMESVRDEAVARAFAFEHLPTIATLLLGGAPLVLLIGVPASVRHWRTLAPLGIAAAVTFVLWLLSVPHTSGGVAYSLRVLTPACVALSIAAGALAPWLTAAPHKPRALALAGIALAAVYATLFCWAHPYGAAEIRVALVSRRSDPMHWRSDLVELADLLDAAVDTPCGVLTDNCYLAVPLQRRTRFRPVMIWSPEVSFLVDPDVDAVEARRRLIERNILCVAASLNSMHYKSIPLYRDDHQHWSAVVGVPDVEAIFRLPQPKAGP